MLPQEIIRTKRDRKPLSEAEIRTFIAGVTDGRVNDGQVASFCMAVLLNGMTLQERVWLTDAMARSGSVMDWTPLGLPGPVVDKHSTGGVGDKVSLILAPIVAACGGFVPMISGRGLGHTGGTLDKLDSIPGYVSQPDSATLKRVVRDVGCAIIGATSDLAPADRRIYSIRDVTATVESLDLITASILSKKLAAGLDALVMDVKFGTGAFMADFDRAVELAESIARVATGAGTPTVALLTDMNQVLGRTAGNAVEVIESLDILAGRNPEPRLTAVTIELSAEMLLLGRLAKDLPEARQKCEQALTSGRAAEHFARMVTALGGPADLLDRPTHYLPLAPVQRPVLAGRAGYVGAMDVRSIGLAVVELGGGRTDPGQAVDHAVSLTDVAPLGAAVGPQGQPLAVIHARDSAAAERAAARIEAAFTVTERAPAPTPLIARRIAG